MSYCLGLHIDDNYIRYAKVLKEENKVPKVETYGVVFYDNIQMAIESIIKETYSYNSSIAINLNGEFYYEFETFAGMDYGNLKKHLKLVFNEEVCATRNLNPSSFDTRFVRVTNDNDEDATKVVYIACNKSSIQKQKHLLGNKISNIFPMSLANLSLVNQEEQQNYAILDIDNVTTFTIVVRGNVKRVVNINLGMGNILSKLTQTYKSYSKSYSECKKIMLLDDTMQQLTQSRINGNFDGQQASDMDNILPILYDIASRARVQLNDYVGIINKIYITGGATAINNIDLYFEQNIGDVTVELLKPHFLANNIEISKKIKEIIEVNGAIALAISPTKIGKDNINFNNMAFLDEAKQLVKENKYVAQALAKLPKKGEKPVKVKNIKEEKPKVSFAEQRMGFWPKTLISGMLVIIVAYIATTTMINMQYENNAKQIEEGTAQLNTVISNIQADTNVINVNSQKYVTLQNNIRVLSEQLDELNGLKYDVPGLLTRIALVTPDQVVLSRISINDSSVLIEAESSSYAPLGFFIASLKTEEIIDNISTTIIQSDSLQKISISGVMK